LFRLIVLIAPVREPIEDLALKPKSLTMEEAAAVPLVALAAWQALVDVARLGRGQKILVHAGAGGLGSTVVQLAKHLGAYVATTVHTSDVEKARGFGAEKVIDFTKANFRPSCLVTTSCSTLSVARTSRGR
jgi:NADPH:quinone reductase-like Zn-dependent oxidoreductase